MILCDGSKQIVDTDSDLAIRTLSQDLNQHAAAVLEGRSPGRFCGFILKYFGFFSPQMDMRAELLFQNTLGYE